MKVSENQVFNLMDTNGRRKDVVHALQGYLNILDNILNGRRMRWQAIPESLAQFEFYKQAIQLSPEVFKKHDKYDEIMSALDKYPSLKESVLDGDIDWIRLHQNDYADILSQFDLGAEDRARHYTSNLVKLGFVDENRNISEVGQMLLGRIPLRKDSLERMLPLNDMNLVYLRQLLKLRVFSWDETRYYSPFCMALFLLLKKRRISQKVFCELVQGMSPYKRMDDLDAFVESYQTGDIVAETAVKIPEALDSDEPLTYSVFERYFKNRKSASAVEVYYQFYTALCQFRQCRNSSSLEALLTVYENEKNKLNKAFGFGRNIFSVKRGERPDIQCFIEQEERILFEDNLNRNLYERFYRSKLLDTITEYSDTTMRIFKATGLIRFDDGYVELACRDLCKYIFDMDKLRSKILGDITEQIHSHGLSYSEYEQGVEAFFCTVQSVSRIFAYRADEITAAATLISGEFEGAPIEKIPEIVVERRKNEFREFVHAHYPPERVNALLGLFSDRSNDGAIKEAVSPDATVPTIYEYVVGLAWYYFSNKSIDLLGSYRLTLSADFEPLTHAGGGAGDIVIYEEDRVVMLEATLMNANSQKRGEWEPVLRHSVNLKIEEEQKQTGREVTTFFIADAFDCNTINIWKAVSSVPLQSSIDKEQFTDNVIIMPVDHRELCCLMDKSGEYREIIQKVRSLFIADETSFDMNWRSRFIQEAIS